MFQWRVINGDYTGNLGLALSHPLYIAIGQFFIFIPLGNLTAKLSFVSGIGMAIALANLAVLATQLTGRCWIGLATASILSVMHTVWWLATITEVYTWNVALLTGELLLLVNLIRSPRWQTAVALAFLNGLNLSVHNLALLTLPVYISVLIVLVARKRLPAWTFVALAGGYIAGASLYIAVIVDFAVKSGDISGAFLSALFGRYSSQVLSTTINWHFIKANAGLASLNFVNFSLPLAVIGWVRMKSCLGGLLAAALLAITVIEFVFFVRYPIPDQFTFFLPSLVMISVAASIGVSVLADISKKWRYAVIAACAASIIIPPAVYANGPEIIRMLGIEIKRERTRPFRDENRYWMIPWKHNERSAEQFAAGALKQAFPDGIIACDGTSYYPLLLVQRRDNLAPSVSLQLFGKIRSQCKKNPMYIPNILSERPLFSVLPVLRFLTPPSVRDNVDIGRKNGEVLYSVRWTGN